MAKETIASLESLSILFYELHQKSFLKRECEYERDLANVQQLGLPTVQYFAEQLNLSPS